MTKNELRREMKRRNLSLSAEERAEASGRIFAGVASTAAFAAARTVALYCALPDEPATEGVLQGWASSKRLVVPRVEGDAMRFFDYDVATLVCGAFGIAEPGPSARECPPGRIDLIVVPGTAFTEAGARMGRGRGYYDRYLAQPGFRAVKVGVCFAHQLVGGLETEPHDVPMDLVVAG